MNTKEKYLQEISAEEMAEYEVLSILNQYPNVRAKVTNIILEATKQG